jgi:Spy/CpxP family protein refolding chaperone
MRSLITLTMLAAIALASFAQEPAPPSAADRAEHHINFLTTVLSLNASQQQQAKTIFAAAEDSTSALHDNMRAAHQALEDAVKTNNSAAIDQAATTIGLLTAQMTALHARSMAAFYQILTPEQQTKFNQLHTEHQGMHWMGPPPF